MIDLWESLFRTLSALAIVLVLMGLVAMVARRVMGNRLGLVGTRPLVHVLASGYVAPRKTIALVSVAGEYLIVGTTATDLVPLGRVDDAAKIQALLDATAPAPPSASAATSGSISIPWLGRFFDGSVAHQKERHREQ